MESKNVRAQAKINVADAANSDSFLVNRSFGLVVSFRRWILGTFVIASVILLLFVNWALPCESDCDRGDS